MAEFQDGEGRTWQVRLDLDAVEEYDRIAEGPGVVEALVTGRGTELYRLNAMIPLLYEGVRDQAEKLEVNYPAFRNLFRDHGTLLQATAAFTEAINEAFPVGEESDEDRPTEQDSENSTNSLPSQE